jgi:hypothetical protein
MAPHLEECHMYLSLFRIYHFSRYPGMILTVCVSEKEVDPSGSLRQVRVKVDCCMMAGVVEP